MYLSGSDIDDDLTHGSALRYALISRVNRREIEMLLIELWSDVPCLHQTRGFAHQLAVMRATFAG